MCALNSLLFVVVVFFFFNYMLFNIGYSVIFFILIKGKDRDMPIFAQTEDTRHPYLITEPLHSVCSSWRSRSNLSYFAGDRSQSELQTETMRILTWVFQYFTEPFCEALSSKVQLLHQGGASPQCHCTIHSVKMVKFAKVLIVN